MKSSNTLVLRKTLKRTEILQHTQLQDQNYNSWHSKPPYWKDYVKMLKITTGPFLDVGCGRAWLAEYIRDYTGMDNSQAAIQVAKKKGHRVLQASAEKKFPFQNHSFSRILLKDVLEHLHNPILAVSESMRVLKPGGYILAFAPDAQAWVWDDYTHVRPYSAKSLRQLFQDSGAIIHRISYEPIMPGIGKFCSYLGISTRPFLFWWLAKLPFMRRNVYIIAQKPK